LKNPLKILEILGVVTGLLYTWFLIEGQEICWLFALASSGIYLYLCFQKRIYAESLLQAFYIFTAVYGWIHWNETDGVVGKPLPWQWHSMIILSGTGMLFITGYLLSRLTDAAQPYTDSFTTVFSVFATLLMINLIPENWLYWIVIDAVSIYLYVKRGLYFTAGLFVLYTFLSIKGALEWML
tara:strand:- start:2591 stop:3136 length:546 start_codon:yes stop_codon:yes gene_type:complete